MEYVPALEMEEPVLLSPAPSIGVLLATDDPESLSPNAVELVDWSSGMTEFLLLRGIKDWIVLRARDTGLEKLRLEKMELDLLLILAAFVNSLSDRNETESTVGVCRGKDSGSDA